MAQDLELRVESNKYEARISILEGYLTRLENQLDGYTELKDSISEFMGDGDDNIQSAQEAVNVAISRCNKGITATKSNIKTLQDTLNNVSNIGANVKTIIDTAIELASAGMFD